MKVVALCLLLVGYASCAVVPLVRAPSLDSAVITSNRIGGNFAYSTSEGHAYAALAPVVQKVIEPVGVTYTARQVPLGYQFYPGFIGSYYPGQPVFANPIFGGGFPAGPAPVAPQPAPAAPPLTGTPIDEDTVAVEAA